MLSVALKRFNFVSVSVKADSVEYIFSQSKLCK